MESIDDLLARVKESYEAQPKSPSPEIAVTPGETPKRDRTADASVDRLLADLGDEYREKERTEARERQQQEEERQQQERQARRYRAEAWLKTLDPLSGEGLWFADFAKDYPSPLQAAIDYLEAIEEVQT